MPSYAFIFNFEHEDHVYELNAQNYDAALAEAKRLCIGTPQDLDGESSSGDDRWEHADVWRDNDDVILYPGINISSITNSYIIELSNPCPIGAWIEEYNSMCAAKQREVFEAAQEEDQRLKDVLTLSPSAIVEAGFMDWVKNRYPQIIERFANETEIADEDPSVSR